MGATAAAVLEKARIEEDHPRWHPWRSAGGSLWATRRGDYRPKTHPLPAGASMTLGPFTEAGDLEEAIVAEESRG